MLTRSGRFGRQACRAIDRTRRRQPKSIIDGPLSSRVRISFSAVVCHDCLIRSEALVESFDGVTPASEEWGHRGSLHFRPGRQGVPGGVAQNSQGIGQAVRRRLNAVAEHLKSTAPEVSPRSEAAYNATKLDAVDGI